ncbi:MAG: hypothetical protein WCJ97_07650 [Phycisphaerae bacterium]
MMKKHMYVMTCLSAAVLLTGVAVGLQAQSLPTAPVADKDNKTLAREAFSRAREALTKERYQDALNEANKALSLDPTLADAQIIQKLATDKLKSPTNGGTSTTQNTEPTTNPADKVYAKAVTLLPEDINRIKVMELSLTDMNDPKNKLQGRIERKALDDFWDTILIKDDRYRTMSRKDRDAFTAQSNFTEQVRLITDLKAAQFYNKIMITADPAFMTNYKTLVQPLILQNCATAACHGGEKAVGFRLYSTPVRPTEHYANFYAISTYVRDGNYMMDRAKPEFSLFIQYLLDPRVARTKHPGDAKLVQRYANDNDPKLKPVADYIKSLQFPAPEYGIAPAKAPVPAPGQP